MKIKPISITLLVLLCFSCKKKEVRPRFDSRGRSVKVCGIRAADGRGPYEQIGEFHIKRCEKEISKLCNKKKFKQVHRTRGHFARGKFGEKIVIGLCP